MLKWRIYIPIVIGSGLTLFAHFTKEIWFILSFVILIPGEFLSLLASRWQSHVSLWVILVANSLVYAAIVYQLVPRVIRRMRSIQPFRAALIVTVAAIAVLCCGWFGAKYYKESGRGFCRNQVVGELISPDGRTKAVTFVRSCRYDGDNSTQVSVLEARREIKHTDQGNIFAADSAHEAPVNEQGAINMSVVWTSPAKIDVQYPQVSRVYWKKDSYRNISVKYETK